MIRLVSLPKALAAGAAGALAWEAVIRLLTWLGLPLYDMVRLLGTLLLPDASAWSWWPAGILLHVAVGAVWAVFYAYFVWSALAWRPVLQGVVFSLVPAILAGLVVHPQLELMHPLFQSGQLHYSGLFGIGAGWREPAGLFLGHLVYGAVLGALYTRPVGYATNRHLRPPNSSRGIRQRRSNDRRPSGANGSGFMFATGIECSYPTLDGGRWRMDEMEMTGHYRHWRNDLELVRDLGLRYLRYGPPPHLIYRGPERHDWSLTDDVTEAMDELGLVPIMDLCHFGLPDWLENFQNPDVPERLAAYAGAFARRYPSVRFYTPVNEMYVCAKMSALHGVWNEQLTGERPFVTAVRHLARSSVLITQAILRERPDAVFINSESSEFFQACCPDPEIRRIADFENQRRFLPLDLLYAHPVRDDIRQYLFDNGMPSEEYAWFMSQGARERAIMGVDYYEWNEQLITRDGRSEALGELFGWHVITSQYYERYRLPMMHTETNRLDARDGPRWLWRHWHNVELLRDGGVPVVGFTWYSLTDQIDWDIGLRQPLGNVNPVGLYDLNRDPRPVALAYKHLIEMYKDERLPMEMPLLDGSQLGNSPSSGRETSP